MAITLQPDKVIVLPPSPPVTFDRLWIEHQNTRTIRDESGNVVVSGEITFRPYRVDGGVTTWAPDELCETYKVADYFAMMAAHPELAAPFQAAFDGVQAAGVALKDWTDQQQA